MTHLYSRTWPQVIRGEPIHLTELVDGGFPTEGTSRHHPRSGNSSNESLGANIPFSTLIKYNFSLLPLHSQVGGVGLVVVRDGKVVGLHCSASELHAGQAAIIQHGNVLAGCQLYFSRRPCTTCLKMLINGEKGGNDCCLFRCNSQLQ